MILVAGGTGTLGRLVVERLAAAGERVRVLTRDAARARALPTAVDDVAIGDVRDEASVAAAVAGATCVVSAVHGFVGARDASPESVDREGNAVLVRAAARAGVGRFVLTSVHDARPDHPMSLHRAKFAAEQELRASGLPFVIVRPTSFLETWLRVIGGAVSSKGQALVFGPGKNPINFVSVRDVAALVALCARTDAATGEVLDIGGPENLGFVDVAARLLAASHDERARIRHVPLPALRALSVLARPFSPVFARQAHAAVVMNTTDMTFDGAARLRERFAAVPTTWLADVVPGA